MSIDFKKYVNIISGVGGGNAVRQRDLIARMITSNPLVSPDAVLEFTGDIATGVGAYFGTTSEEYKRAVAYASYVSPSIAAAKKLSFSRWSEAGNDPKVIGNNDAKSLASIQAITAGGITVRLAGVSYNVAGVSFAASSTLAAAAAALQVAIRAANAALAGATVAYAADGPSRFTVTVPAATGKMDIVSVTSGAQDIGVKFGLSAAANAISIASSLPQTPLDAFIKSIDITNNFGSFLFLDELDLAEVESVAAHNSTLNVMYIYAVPVKFADYATWYAALKSYAGIGLTLMDDVNYPDEYPDQIPATIMGATDYTKRNGVQNYMFKQFSNVTALVTDTLVSNNLDASRINYYGETQTAGQRIAFYQRGKLMGLATAPVDMNVYANEAWFKDYCGAQIMSLQLSLSRLAANDGGVGAVLNILQQPIDDSLFNGVISVGKPLTPVQKVFIESITGDALAWYKVQNVGYVVSAKVESYVTTDGSTEYKIVYSLIYSKDDAVRLVEGTHTLI